MLWLEKLKNHFIDTVFERVELTHADSRTGDGKVREWAQNIRLFPSSAEMFGISG
jgi:hypothetical protein